MSIKTRAEVIGKQVNESAAVTVSTEDGESFTVKRNQHEVDVKHEDSGREITFGRDVYAAVKKVMGW